MGLLMLMGGGDFNVRQELFSQNEQGTFLDPSTYISGGVYQDANGITACGSPGDLVGLVLDQRQGALTQLGADLVSNGSFATDTVWTKGANWTIGSGVATKTGGAANNLTQTISSTAAAWYRVSLDVTRSAGTLTVSLGTSGTTYAITATGSYTFFILAGSGTQTLTLAGDSSFDGTVDNVVVRNVPGNHAYQSTSGARPVLNRAPFGGRRNLLSSSEPMATQTQTVRAVQHTLSFQGTGTVTLSGVSTAGPLIGTGASDTVSLTFTPTAGSLTLTVSGSVTFAQLEEGSARSNYQRVVVAGTVVDCTEAGRADCWYLDFSSSKWMQTAAIDFTGTDEMTVIAGVRKLADLTRFLIELSVNSESNNGAFGVLAAGTVTPTYGLTHRGANSTTRYATTPETYISPITNLLTFRGDLSSSVSQLYVDTVLAASSALALGGGNYGNYALYIGSRGGSSVFFNGHLYSLIVRGKTTEGSKLTGAERFVARKTGLTI